MLNWKKLILYKTLSTAYEVYSSEYGPGSSHLILVIQLQGMCQETTHCPLTDTGDGSSHVYSIHLRSKTDSEYIPLSTNYTQTRKRLAPKVNAALLLKICWVILTSTQPWGSFADTLNTRAKFCIFASKSIKKTLLTYTYSNFIYLCLWDIYLKHTSLPTWFFLRYSTLNKHFTNLEQV